MATFIKVEQNGSELLRRNQEQAQAARLAKLEGDEQSRTEKEAKRQRQAELQRQGLDASGNALGDSRRRQPFRRDEPAASLVPYESFVIYWEGLNPLITDPQAILQPWVTQVNQQASAIGNVPAISSGPPEDHPAKYSLAQAVFQLANHPRASADFTLEAWGQCPPGNSGDGGNGNAGMRIQLLWGLAGNQREVLLLARNWPDGLNDPGNASASFDSGFYVGAVSPFIDDAKLLEVDPTHPYHLCIQRIQSVYRFYINGVIQFVDAPPEGTTPALTDPAWVYLQSDSFNVSAGNKLGQLRMTYNRARYAAAGFTPNPMPFR